MATKLKNFSYHKGTKAGAFLLICLLFGCLVVMAATMFGFVREGQNYFAGDYSIATASVIVFILGMLTLIYSIAVCGRNKEGELALMAIDRLWTDAALAFIAGIAVLQIIALLIINGFSQHYSTLSSAQAAITLIISALLCSIGLMLLLSIARHIKNRSFIKHSLTYKVLIMLKAAFKTIFDYTPLKIKIIAAILLAELIAVIAATQLILGSLTFWGFLFLLLAGNIGLAFITFNYVIKPYDDEVNVRLRESLATEMKAERLKTELITNVSHDLKTPLTALINYSDLLLKQDEKNEYAKIIYEKSRKLQFLTEDLFEMSKAQSGNINVNMENLKILELINQTLAEFNEHSIDFKINIPDLTIQADGKLMSRALENLIGNIIKYSLPNTRSYIDAYEEGEKVYLTLKNIANYEMNFESGEMMERFSRGDLARTTEGSGLGLAIAQSYVEACGGKLNIEVDGDLFKAALMFHVPQVPRARFS